MFTCEDQSLVNWIILIWIYFQCCVLYKLLPHFEIFRVFSHFLVAKLKQTLHFLLSRSLNLTSCVCFFFNTKEQLLQGNSLVFVQRKCEQMGNKDCSCNKVLFPFLSMVLIVCRARKSDLYFIYVPIIELRKCTLIIFLFFQIFKLTSNHKLLHAKLT